MLDFVDMFKPLGPIGGIIAAVLFAAAIWWLSQSNSEPGTPVSILWGLTSYTKRSTRLREQTVIFPFFKNNYKMMNDGDLVITLDAINSTDEIYIKVNGQWLRQTKATLAGLSPKTRRLLYSTVLLNRRTKLTFIAMAFNWNERNCFVLGRLENESFAVSFNKSEYDKIGHIKVGDQISCSCKITTMGLGDQSIDFGDGTIIDAPT